MATPVITNLNPISENITFQKTGVSDKFYTSILLNYVEPVEVNGSKKTVFYTKNNTNFNVGDRIFILNGNYDSNNFIAQDKYTKYTDGYRVLACDGCRLILDLDFTGELPYIKDQENKSIKVYHVRNQKEFDYINSLYVNHNQIIFLDNNGATRTYFSGYGRFSKFCGKRDSLDTPIVNYTAILCSDSIIYIDGSFNGSNLIYNLNSGVSGTGFFVRDDSMTVPTWVNVSQDIIENRIKIVNSNYSDVEKNLFIYGEDFTFNNIEFKQRNTYRHDGSWGLNVKYKVPYISRLNFRFGNFRGKHQDGIFGTNLKKNNWNSAVWTSGAFINSIWNKGAMSSKSNSGEKFFFSTFDTQSRPIQTLDFNNNRGFGFNFIEDSSFKSGDIKNGNFENCNLGIYSTFSVMDVYFGLTYSFDLRLSGSFRRCDITNITSTKARFSNSNVLNSNLNNSSLVNSQIYYSTALSSTFTDEEGINVIASDLWSFTTNQFDQNFIRGTLKLYISDEDFKKLGIGDSFYLSKLNKNLFLSSLTNDQKIKINVETRFLMDIYTDLELESGKVIVSIKNKNDNKLKTKVIYDTTNFSNNFSSNQHDLCSIDIESQSFGWYESVDPITLQSSTVTVPQYCLSPVLPQSVNLFFSGTYVKNADFRSGYFDKSVWQSGSNINYSHHIILFSGQNLRIVTDLPNTITVTLQLSNQLNANQSIYGDDLLVNDIVWLNSIDHIVGTQVKSIDGRYRVTAVNRNTTFNVKTVTLRTLTGLTFATNAVYRNNQSRTVRYASIHKFRINSSTINSGLLCRTSLKNSTIFNPEFNNSDRNLDIVNIDRLKLINMSFKDTGNNIKSGYVFKSHIINDIWSNGIAFNSIWNGATFSNGVFNSGYWQRGLFRDGSFINSRDTQISTQDYDSSLTLYRSWLNGTFQNGDFYNSVWANGTFSNGRFHNSEWFAGVWNNGILGNSNLKPIDTKFGYSSVLPQSFNATNSVWKDGIVENAVVGGDGIVFWMSGKFQNGEFTSNGETSTNESVWYNGEFNNGRFTGLARWKNGKFFKGKFLSHLGMNSASAVNPSTFSNNYAWEFGKFYGGEFGNASTGTNSVWYDGEFYGGVFQGRFWYKGLFHKGDFVGSGNVGQTDSIYNSNISSTGEYNFADSFTNSYYGLWFNGDVSDDPKVIKSQQKVFTEIVRKIEEQPIENTVNFKNMLWINGTFSHKSAKMENSLWLNGYFYDGVFDSSIFNPFVDRNFTGNFASSSFASTQSCIWYNGNFESNLGTGSFYISNWKEGRFENGYMSGATWENGIWNYGFADNILWLDGLWRNGNWNGSPFGYDKIELVTPSLMYTVTDDRTSKIMVNVGLNLGTISTIYLNNVFSASIGTNVTNPGISTLANFSFDQDETYPFDIPTRPVGVFGNTSDSIVTFYDAANWFYSSSLLTINNSQLNTPNVYTFGGDRPPGFPKISPPSSKLYALSILSGPTLGTKNVFSQADKTYLIFLDLIVEGDERVDVFIKVGNKDELKLTLTSLPILENGRFTYYGKRYSLRFVYSTTTVASNVDREFYVQKGFGGTLRITKLHIIQKDYEYHPVHNNATYSNAIDFTTNIITLPTETNISYEAFSTDCNTVEVGFGNGLFKSGVWENGVWNNGIRSNILVDEEDYYKFSNVVGLNGILPYQGKGTYQIDSFTWLITLQSIDTLTGLNIGDKVSIGNIVAIDINESRKLIKDYFTIKELDFINATIVVEFISNFPVLRVERDSPNHLIYVTKNIWLTGAFLNGLFRGVWNNGLFKSYPQIGIMGDTHWIDGTFDGGRFISKKYKNVFVTNYNSALVQNFTFIDNRVESNTKRYLSWMDLNYSTTQKSTVNLDSTELVFDIVPPLSQDFPQDFNAPKATFSYFNELSSGLEGFVTPDVLQSTSFMKTSGFSVATPYSLGTKYTVYSNLIPNNGNFLEPNSNSDFGATLDNFTEDGWYFTDYGTTLQNYFDNNQSTSVISETYKSFNPIRINSNIGASTANKLRIFTPNTFESAIIHGSDTSQTTQLRFAKIILNNENIETIKNRYYMTTLDLATYSLTAATWSTSPFITQTKKISIVDSINENDSSGLLKRQFFYNKRNLNLTIEVSSQVVDINNTYVPSSTYPNPVVRNSFDLTFNNISFEEIDMIPFFNYFGNNDNIDRSIQTPWQAVAPTIDYGDTNFNFINNVDLTISSDVVGNQVNYSTLSSGGVFGSIIRDGSNETVITESSQNAELL